MDDYVKDKIREVKELIKINSEEFDDDLEVIFNKVYEDGFKDGEDEKEPEDKSDSKIEAYKEHYVVMMNDLTKDELIEQIWDAKPYSEKLEEANEFTKCLKW